MPETHIVNPALIAAYPHAGKTPHTAIWDVLVTPDNEVYASFCTEGMPAGVNAHLARLNRGTGLMETCLDLREVVGQHPDDTRMPHSKIHTSMSFHEGSIFFLTYTTSPGIGHEFWDLPQLIHDPVDGYEGSHFVQYVPATGHWHDRGIPVPREPLYGGLLDPEHRRYYYLTYLSGRLGYVDLDRHCRQDCGRVSRSTSFILFHDRQYRIYGAARDGQLWRYDPTTNRMEQLPHVLPRRRPEDEGGIFIIQANQKPDGSIIGGCRGGNPFWRFHPEDGPCGRLENLGNPWPDLEGGGFDSGWIPLLGRDGWLYYWTATKPGEDISLVRMHPETRVREELGFGWVAGKTLGIWIGPGAVGPDGTLYWGDCGYEIPRLIAYHPDRPATTPTTISRELPPAPQRKTPTGAGLDQHPVDLSWGGTAMDRQRLAIIPVCGKVAPYGACAITGLCPVSGSRLAGALSGRERRLFLLDDTRMVTVFHHPVPGSNRHALAYDRHGNRLLHAWSTESGGEILSTPLSPQGLHGETQTLLRLPGEGILALVRDDRRMLIHALTATARVVTLDSSGHILRAAGPICDRQISPVMLPGSDGAVYGAGRGGMLWRLGCGEPTIRRLDLQIPGPKGNAYSAEWRCAAGADEVLYGGTSHGFLFKFIIDEHRIVNLGMPTHGYGLEALALAPGGTLYGASGHPHADIAHVFSWTPASGFCDLGQIDSKVPPLGGMVRLGSMACLPDGALYIGEADDISHLAHYTPAPGIA